MDIKAMREEFAQLNKDNRDLISKVASEKREYTAEETTQKETRFARMDLVKKLVEDYQRNATSALAEGNVETPEPAGKKDFDGNSGGQKRAFTKQEYADGLNHFIRTNNFDGLHPQMRAEFGTISTSGSSALLPRGILPPVAILNPANIYKSILALYGLPVLSTGDTQAINLPLVDDTANVGATKTEGATSETTPVDATPSAVNLTTVLKEAKPCWFSNTMLNQNRFDFIAYFLPQLQQRLERAEHSATDTAVKAVSTGSTTAASASAITYAEILTWEHAVPIAYRSNLSMVVADSFYKLIRGLTDSQARPIMDQDPVNVFQSKVHGIPVFVSEYMTAVATGVTCGAIVNANSLYLREENPRITRYERVPAYPDQVGLNIFADFAAGVNSNGVRIFKMG